MLTRTSNKFTPFQFCSLVSLISLTSSVLTRVPVDEIITSGSTVVLTCYTNLSVSVMWQVDKAGDFKGKRWEAVYQGYPPAITDDYRERFKVINSSNEGKYNLMISSVRHEDAGTYRCVDDMGYGLGVRDQKSVHYADAELIVIDKKQNCSYRNSSSQTNPPQLIAMIKCSLGYRGNISPNLQTSITYQGTSGESFVHRTYHTSAHSVKDFITSEFQILTGPGDKLSYDSYITGLSEERWNGPNYTHPENSSKSNTILVNFSDPATSSFNLSHASLAFAVGHILGILVGLIGMHMCMQEKCSISLVNRMGFTKREGNDIPVGKVSPFPNAESEHLVKDNSTNSEDTDASHDVIESTSNSAATDPKNNDKINTQHNNKLENKLSDTRLSEEENASCTGNPSPDEM